MRKLFTIFVSLVIFATHLLADATQPLNFTAVNGPATIKLVKDRHPDSVSLQYSTDNCSTWSYYAIGQEIPLQSGAKVFFKANSKNAKFSKDKHNYYYFVMIGVIKSEGSIMSLLDETFEQDSVPEYAFYSLFRNCPITTTPELPAMTLGKYCYANIFTSCDSLELAPKLSATVLDTGCYEGMFNDCASLITVPVLPATTLAAACYSFMFFNCRSLKTIPKLPATILADYCYNAMFMSCTSLKINTTVPGKEWQIPTDADTAGIQPWGELLMFDGTSGNFTGNPEPGVTYYIASDTTTTAVENINDDVEITLFPNPIHIGEPAYINTTDGIQSVEIYNPDGKCIQHITPTSSPIRIDNLTAAGIYIIRLTTKNNTSTTRKLIVQ